MTQRTGLLCLLLGAVGFAQGPGIITTVAGTGVRGFNQVRDNAPLASMPAREAHLNFTEGNVGQIEQYAHITFDTAGNLYIPDQLNNLVRRVSPDGLITTFAGRVVRLSDGSWSGEHSFSGNGVPATEAALDNPTALKFDSSGNLYIADQHNNRVRRVTPAGVISTFAGGSAAGFSGNGGQATSALLASPGGLAVDAEGSVYIADTFNNQVRRVSRDGTITAFAGVGGPVAGHGFSGDDGAATQALLDYPAGLAFDAQGNLYIADQHNNRIRRVGRDGRITTVAGSGPVGPGNGGFAGDGQVAVAARLNNPTDVAFDAAGNMYIADQGNNVIRRVTPDGVIATVVGNRGHGFGGDNGSPLNATLDFPSGLAFDRDGNLYFTDQHNLRVRKVTFSPPALSITPGTMSFAARTGGPNPAFQTFLLSNPGVGALNYAITSDQSWLTATPASGALPTGGFVTVTVQVNIANLAAGDYAGTLTIQAPGAANSPQTLRVTLTVQPPPQTPAFPAAGVVDAASFLSVAAAPGQIVSIFGTNLGPATGVGAAIDPATGRLLTSRGGVTVLFNDVPGPLFFVRQDQINVQVPYEVAGQASMRIVVRNLDVSSAPVTVPVGAAAPGIFAVSGGRGQAAMLNQDSSVNSAANPAARGSVVQIFLTGQGATNPPAVTGQLPVAPFPAPVLPVTITIGGRTAATPFVGLAPGLAGLLQINAVVPQETAPGDNVSLQVTIGGVASQPGVTLAVR